MDADKQKEAGGSFIYFMVGCIHFIFTKKAYFLSSNMVCKQENVFAAAGFLTVGGSVGPWFATETVIKGPCSAGFTQNYRGLGQSKCSETIC